MTIKTVFFDLDDTLFDHQHSRRCALKALGREYSALSNVPLNIIESYHDKHLLTTYTKMLDGNTSQHESRIERMRLLFAEFGVFIDAQEAELADSYYRRTYDDNRRPIAGSIALLQELSKVKQIGIITNGLSQEQRDKLALCQLDQFVNLVIISEEVKVRKPTKEFFKIALGIANTLPSEGIVVGDSWENDILCASQLGLKCIWLNRYNFNCPNPGLAIEISALEPLDSILPLFLDSH